MKVRHRSQPEQTDKPLWHDGPGGDEDRTSGRDNAKTSGESLAVLTDSTTRRGLFRAGAGLAAAVSGITPGLAAPAVAADAIKVPNRPNIIVLMTAITCTGRKGGPKRICRDCNGSRVTVFTSTVPTLRPLNVRPHAG